MKLKLINIHRFQPALLILFLFSFFTACKQDKQFTERLNQLQGPLKATAVSERNARIWQALRDGLPQRIIQKNQIQFLDTSTTDGDGFEICFQFGTGTMCGDGLVRKGKLYAKSTGAKSFANADSILLWANSVDSFGILGGQSWFYTVFETTNYSIKNITGAFASDWKGTFWGNGLDSGKIQGKFNYKKENAGFQIGYFQDNYYLQSATLGISTGSNTFDLSAENIFEAAGCTYGWLSGFWEIKTEQYTAKVNINPFSNSACDPVCKIGIGSREQTLDFW